MLLCRCVWNWWLRSVGISGVSLLVVVVKCRLMVYLLLFGCISVLLMRCLIVLEVCVMFWFSMCLILSSSCCGRLVSMRCLITCVVLMFLFVKICLLCLGLGCLIVCMSLCRNLGCSFDLCVMWLSEWCLVLFRVSSMVSVGRCFLVLVCLIFLFLVFVSRRCASSSSWLFIVRSRFGFGCILWGG